MIQDTAERDAAEYVEASYDDHPVDHIEPLARREIAGADAVAEILRLTAEARNPRLLSYAFLLLINRCPYSEEDIGARIGVTKQAVSVVKRRLERWLGMKSRNGRAEAAIEKFTSIALARYRRQKTGGGMADYKRHTNGHGSAWSRSAMHMDSLWQGLSYAHKLRVREWAKQLSQRPVAGKH